MKQTLILLLLLSASVAGAKDIYVSQNGAGAANGSDAADADAESWLDSSSNWGGGSSQVNPGDTVHLVGTFTSALTLMGSGTPGNPVTIYFENGANFTAACWPATGAIALNNQAYIIIDGGVNGLIQNTNNGTTLGLQNPSTGIASSLAANIMHDITIQNLTVTNIYVRTTGSEDPAVCGNCILVSGSSITISNCNVSDGGGGIGYSGPQPGDSVKSNIFILNSRILDWNHGITVAIGNSQATNSNCLLTNVVIAGNFLDHADMWDGNHSLFHMDGIILFNNTGDPSVVITGLRIYQNLWGPNFAATNTTDHGDTAAIAEYLDGPAAQCQNTYIYNNVFQTYAANSWANGFVNAYGSNIWVVNNTCEAIGSNVSEGVEFNAGGTNAYCYNNLFMPGAGLSLGGFYGSYINITVPNNGASNLWVLTNFCVGIWSDYNSFEPDANGVNSFGLELNAVMAGPSLWVSGVFNTFQKWQTYEGNEFNWPAPTWNMLHCDPHSTASMPNFIPGTYVPAANDVVAHNAGTNLTWLGITNDFYGNPRSATSNWDIGAFIASTNVNTNFVPSSNVTVIVQSGGTLSAPTNLHVIPVVTNVINGLLAWWTLDDMTGTDSSGNGHTGTIAGSPATVTAIASNGLSWNGVSTQAFTFPAAATLSSTFTVTMWINTSVQANYQTLIYDTAGSTGFFLHSLNLDMYNGNDNVSSAPITQGAWCFVAVVVSSGSGAFYVNSTTAGTFTCNRSPAFNVLASENPGTAFVGMMDDVRIYNRALTPSEITDLFYWRGQP